MRKLSDFQLYSRNDVITVDLLLFSLSKNEYLRHYALASKYPI